MQIYNVLNSNCNTQHWILAARSVTTSVLFVLRVTGKAVLPLLSRLLSVNIHESTYVRERSCLPNLDSLIRPFDSCTYNSNQVEHMSAAGADISAAMAGHMRNSCGST